MTAAEDGSLREPRVAVILAAGRGERLRVHGRSCPKPLTPVFGVSLAERVVRGLLEAAPLERVVVSIGYEAEGIRHHFEQIGTRCNIPMQFVSAEQWQCGNGTSALAAAAVTGDQAFILTMTDHLVSPVIITDLMADSPDVGGVCLAVDRDKTAILDLDDVTRVRLDGDRILAIGKDLASWDAADTGVFLCTSALYDALTEAAGQGRHGLSDAIAILAGKGQARTVDVTGRWWTDVDTPAALKDAESRLIAQLGNKSHDGPISRYLNRPLSIRISRRLARLPVTPNQISLFSFISSVLAASLFLVGNYAGLLMGGLFAQFASIIDGCDGEIARLKYLSSEYGGWLDAVLDRYADGLLLFGLTWHGYSVSSNNAYWVIGFLAIMGSFLLSYTADKYDGLMKSRSMTSGRGMGLRMGRDVRVFLIFVGAILNQVMLTLAVIAAVMNLETIRRMIVCRNE